MWDALPLTPLTICVAIALAFLAGLVKGVTGFGLPMVLIAGLGSFLSPELALAGLILPTLVTNLWQAVRQGVGAAFASARKHWRFVLIGLFTLAFSAQLVTRLPERTLFLLIGLPVIFFAALQLIGWRPQIDPENRGKAEVGIGVVAGTLGGLSGIWGPPTVLYLTALNTPKVEHVRVQGVVYGTGAIALVLAHLNSGVLNGPGLSLSALLILPGCLGLFAGFAILDRLDQEKFRTATLIVLIIAGLNLIRRGLLG